MSDENEKQNDEKEIKVTDRRMFTSDGELREEFRGRVDESGGESGGESPTSVRPSAASSPGGRPGGASPGGGIVGPDAAAGPAAARPGATSAPATPKASAPQTPEPGSAGPSPSGEEAADGESEYPSGAQFEDLIGLLAQGASVYLQQARQPERRSEHLELARLHVDLLAILKKKTEGNLAAGEKALLDDALYQLRMAVVQHG